MFCQNCGSQIPDDARFCEKCGAPVGAPAGGNNEVITGEMIKNTANAYAQKAGDFLKNSGMVALSDAEAQRYNVSNNSPELQNIFMQPDERFLAQLGNGYLVNLLFNRLKKCNALLTDRRVYFKGTFYNRSGKSIIKTTEERILDLEDVTGTGFIYQRFSIIMLFLALLFGVATVICLGYSYDLGPLFILPLIPAIVFAVLTYTSRKVFFFVDYAGGSIEFDAQLIGLPAVQEFHKQIRRAKDALKQQKRG